MMIELQSSSPNRGSRRRTRRKIGHVLLNVVLWVMAIACVFPFLWTLSTSLKPENNALTGNFFFGYHLTWSNYSQAWHFFPFGRFMINTAIMSIGGVAVTLIVATTGGYAFARLRFPWKEKVFFLYIATLLVPASVTIIPLFLITRDLHMYNSYWGLIFPISFGAFGTFFMRQFFRTLPNELSDSAKIDGASEARIFFTIMLPLVRPAAAVLGVFTFISDWGNFLWPLIATQSTNMSTLTLGLSTFQSQYGSYWSYMMAGTLLAILPTVILVIILQKYLVRGLAFTAFGGR